MTRQYISNAEDNYRVRGNGSSVRRLATRLRALYLELIEAIEGIEDRGTRSRYASLLLNRLLFLAFLQHTGLLAGNPRYLQQRLEHLQTEAGGNFYREVLRPLFTASCPTDVFPEQLVHLFTSRVIEQKYPALSLANGIFTRIFALFDEYRWQCDDLAQTSDDVVTPELFGALLAQNVQPREMGAYYTPEEIASYIVRTTLLPALFTRVRERYASSGTPDRLLWQQLASQPERYLFAAARKGCEYALPPEIAAGYQDIARRQLWQRPAPEPYALPGETWSEVIERRASVAEIVACCQQNTADGLDRFVTWNVDQQLLALETLRACQQPEFLVAFYESLSQLTILDPTCGPGAFLCAAISQLEALYSACLTRMEELLSAQLAPPYRCLFRRALQEVGETPGRPASIRRLIIERNLYGVDLMEEAVETCRLCFFLQLLAASPGYALAYLTRDFGQHIRAGNCLVGSLSAGSKAQLEQSSPTDGLYASAFHWSEAFPEVMGRGGFDVALGNPPYVEYERVRSLYTVDGYTTLETGNLYALTMERAAHLLAPGGRFGMIVPSSATCTDGYRSLQRLLLEQQELHIASFSDQRGHLFALPHPRLCIILYTRASVSHAGPGRLFTTPYLKLGRGPRSSLFEQLRYTEVSRQVLRPGIIPRYGSSLEQSIHEKLMRQAFKLGQFLQSSSAYPVYYTRKLSWFVQVTPFIPRILDEQGCPRTPSELKTLYFASAEYAHIAFAALNSNLFYWLITTSSDCRNLNLREVSGLPLDLASVHPALQQELCQLASALADDLRAHSCMREMAFRDKGRLTIQCMYPARSKDLIDEIDRLLARHYAFSAEELDFLLHYDAQYRANPLLKQQ